MTTPGDQSDITAPSSTSSTQAPDVMRQRYRQLNPTEAQTMANVKTQGMVFWSMLDAMGNSRELSLAKTQIEEAVMWAVKHITR